MDNSKRMAMTQAKGSGAPPSEPPMAPPDQMEPQGDDGMGGGMPPPEQVIPEVAKVLEQMAMSLPDDKKQMIMSAVQQLQAAFPADSANSGGMPPDDSEAYGEQPTV